MEQKKNKKRSVKSGTKEKRQASQVKEIRKVEPKTKDNSTKYLCLFIVVIAFTFAFMLLINKQSDSYMNDIMDGGFNIKPVEGEVIVARDLNAIYPKYYVAYTHDDNFAVYVYNYYETVSQYELEYNRLIDSIVDYNEKDKMIRYILYRGYGTYEEVLNNLSISVESSNIKIY